MTMWAEFAYTKNVTMECGLGTRQVSLQSLTIVEMFGIFNTRGVQDQNHYSRTVGVLFTLGTNALNLNLEDIYIYYKKNCICITQAPGPTCHVLHGQWKCYFSQSRLAVQANSQANLVGKALRVPGILVNTLAAARASQGTAGVVGLLSVALSVEGNDLAAGGLGRGGDLGSGLGNLDCLGDLDSGLDAAWMLLAWCLIRLLIALT